MKRIGRATPWVDPDEAALNAATAAQELERREAAAAAAAEALLNVRCSCLPTLERGPASPLPLNQNIRGLNK